MTQKEKAPFCCHRNGAAPMIAHRTHASSIPRIAAKCTRIFLHIMVLCICVLITYFFAAALIRGVVMQIVIVGEMLRDMLGGIV